MALIRLFLDISLFKKGPQDVPASTALLLLTVLGNLAIGIGLAAMDGDLGEAAAQALVGSALLAGFLSAALYLASKTMRCVKTCTAAFGCDTLISVLAIPLLLWGQSTPEAMAPVAPLLMVLMLWQMAVIGHILRHALSIPFVAGLGLALAYTVISYGIIIGLFPLSA